jgi:hypothetical protein
MVTIAGSLPAIASLLAMAAEIGPAQRNDERGLL